MRQLSKSFIAWPESHVVACRGMSLVGLIQHGLLTHTFLAQYRQNMNASGYNDDVQFE